MTKLTNIILRKENKYIELQGMIHISNSAFYDAQQKKIDSYSDGIVFYEGVGKNNNWNFNAEENNINSFFKTIFQLMPELASALNLTFQGDAINYPLSAVNADISYETLIKELARRKSKLGIVGKKCEKYIQNQKDLDEVKKIFKKISKKKEEIYPSRFLLFIAKKILFRKFFSVVLDYRNKKAVEIIIETIEKVPWMVKFLVLYGDAHIKGMVKLLKKNGWEIVI